GTRRRGHFSRRAAERFHRIRDFFRAFFAGGREEEDNGVAVAHVRFEQFIDRFAGYFKVSTLPIEVESIERFRNPFLSEPSVQTARSKGPLEQLQVVFAGRDARSELDVFREHLDSAIGLVRRAERKLEYRQQLESPLGGRLEQVLFGFVR